jgi:hypothetical protein
MTSWQLGSERAVFAQASSHAAYRRKRSTCPAKLRKLWLTCQVLSGRRNIVTPFSKLTAEPVHCRRVVLVGSPSQPWSAHPVHRKNSIRTRKSRRFSPCSRRGGLEGRQATRAAALLEPISQKGGFSAASSAAAIARQVRRIQTPCESARRYRCYLVRRGQPLDLGVA